MSPMLKELAEVLSLLIRRPQLAFALAVLGFLAFLIRVMATIALASNDSHATIFLAAFGFTSIGVAFWIVREFMRPNKQ